MAWCAESKACHCSTSGSGGNVTASRRPNPRGRHPPFRSCPSRSGVYAPARAFADLGARCRAQRALHIDATSAQHADVPPSQPSRPWGAVVLARIVECTSIVQHLARRACSRVQRRLPACPPSARDALETEFEAESSARRPKLFFLVRRVEPGVRQRICDRGSMACIVTTFEPSAALVIIAAMVTPALLILASASLVATALMRMARVVDRARALTAVAYDGAWARVDGTPNELRTTLKRHASRARLAEWSIALLYTAVVFFVTTCISIVIDHEAAHSLSWLPSGLAIMGTLVLLVGGALMVAESRLGGEQISQEIRQALIRLDKVTP